MTAIPLLGGMAANPQAEFIESPPVNLEYIVMDNGISKGQFRAPSGVVTLVEHGGEDRGAVVWNGRHFRVIGEILVELTDGNFVVRGNVGGTGPVGLAYGFDRLAIRSSGKLFYFTTALVEITDIDLGMVNDMLWVDGFYMTTDGTSIIVTELNDPTQIEPLKYGSAEEDPDMVTGLMKVRGEVYVLGRYTIEILQNIGGNGFPFRVIDTATIPYGCVSASAKCEFAESFAFVGSKKSEALGVYIAGSGTAQKISTRALDRDLEKLPDPSVIEMESRSYLDEQRLLVHLPNKTWVFCLEASKRAEQSLWYVSTSEAKRAVEYNGQFYVGSPNKVGRLSHDISEQFGEPMEWQFQTSYLSNKGLGFILKAIELVGLPGRSSSEVAAFLSMSRDGEIWSNEAAVSMGAPGERGKRLHWRPRVNFSNFAMFRFRGHGLPGIAGIEADIEALAR